MIFSDDVSDDYSIDDGTECDGDYVETREGDSESAEDATSDTTHNSFHLKEQDEVW
jgi:hypothetical protein